MEKLKQYKYIILIQLIFLGSVFYWYEWRPTQIKKKCFAKEVVGVYSITGTYFDKSYRACLSENGL